MDGLNWGLIRSGATFERLVQVLLCTEDPTMVVFGKAGPDGGQDAVSGDRTHAFQAKFHTDNSISRVIVDAKKEARKIRKFREEDHRRQEQWKRVTKWELVTNVPFGETGIRRWREEVVELFRTELQMEARLCHQAQLEQRVLKHPEIVRAFFENRTRVFLSVGEAIEEAQREHESVLGCEQMPFMGRDEEIQQFRDFLRGDKRWLVVSARGGVGKTRLLLEAGLAIASEGTWEVLWAQVDSLLATKDWFDAVLPERPTLLLIDDPDDDRLLRVLKEQSVSRLSSWRLAVAIRPAIQSVSRFFQSWRVSPEVEHRRLKGLAKADAKTLVVGLLRASVGKDWSDSRIERLAFDLAVRFHEYPLWLEIAAFVHSREPNSTDPLLKESDVAAQYVTEILKPQQGEPETRIDQYRALLRWIALLGPLNREDKDQVNLIASRLTGVKRSAMFDRIVELVERGALIERGARLRIVEVKPDPVRDFILQDWLIQQSRIAQRLGPTEAGNELIEDISIALREGQVSRGLTSKVLGLARADLANRVDNGPLILLPSLFNRLLENIPNFGARARIATISILIDFAELVPELSLKLSSTLRQNAVETETTEDPWENETYGQDQVILSLASLVSRACRGAATKEMRSDAIRELCAVLEAEEAVYDRHPELRSNSGRQAAVALKHCLGGGPEYYGDFEEGVQRIAKELLARSSKPQPSPGLLNALQSVLQLATEIERMMEWQEGPSYVHQRVVHQRVVHLTNSKQWGTRSEILKGVRAALENSQTPIETRLTLWKVLAAAHANANQCRNIGSEDESRDRQAELLERLNWAEEALKSGPNKTKRELRELQEARQLWKWHLKYDDDRRLKEAATRIEAVYRENEVAAEFELFAGDLGWNKYPELAAQKAQELARSSGDSIAQFVERGHQFFGGPRPGVDKSQIIRVAVELGKLAHGSHPVRQHVQQCLANPSLSSHALEFTCPIVASWIDEKRLQGPERGLRVLKRVRRITKSDRTTINVLWWLYRSPRTIGPRTHCWEEVKLLRECESMFRKEKALPHFVRLVGGTIHTEWNWEELRELITRIIGELNGYDRDVGLHMLIEAGYWALSTEESYTISYPQDLGPWLVEQLLRGSREPSRDDLRQHMLETILAKVGRLPLSWVADQVAKSGAAEKLPRLREITAFHAGGHDYSEIIEVVTETSAKDEKLSEAAASLVALIQKGEPEAWVVYELLASIDPKGFVVPGVVHHLLSGDLRMPHIEARRIARIGGYYEPGSAPWRQVVAAAVRFAQAAIHEEKVEIYSALLDARSKSWVGLSGKVPVHVTESLARAERLLDEEQNSEIREFLAWHLEVIRSEYRYFEDRATEDHEQ